MNSEVLLDAGTAHLCIVDKEENAVSITMSINDIFESYVISPKTGVLLNDLMNDFEKSEALPRDKNPLSASRNLIGPRKKPLSSMSPTMLVKNGKLKMVIGASGGAEITTCILQVLSHRFKQNLDLESAVLEPRLHDSLLGGETYYEDSKMGDYYFHTSDTVIEELRSRGHNVSRFQGQSHIAAIEIREDGTRVGVADPRKDGAASAP